MFVSSEYDLRASSQDPSPPASEGAWGGFRVVYLGPIPEPGVVGMMLVGAVVLLPWWKRGRSEKLHWQGTG